MDGVCGYSFFCEGIGSGCECSLARGGQQHAAAVIRKSCTGHLQAAIGILQPTLVVSQGSGLVQTLRVSFGVTYPMSTDLGTNLARCDLDGNQFIWVALRHPTRNWSSINQPYFRDTVVPTLQQARKRALKLPQPV